MTTIDYESRPNRALFARSPSRSLFIAPTPNRSSGENIRQVRFINFTQILINRNRRLNLTTVVSPSPSSSVRNIRKKYIRLGGNGHLQHTTTMPRSTTLVKTFPPVTSTTTVDPIQDVRESRANQFGKKKKKKTLVKVKVKNGDQQMLLYDHSAKRPTTTTSTTTTTESPTTTVAQHITTMAKELSRKKKQDNHSATDDSPMTTPEDAEDGPDSLEGEDGEIDQETIIPTTTEVPTTVNREDVYE
ncbi:hypothetical protein BLA29_009131, partial [Euroglyphus maynei]